MNDHWFHPGPLFFPREADRGSQHDEAGVQLDAGRELEEVLYIGVTTTWSCS